MRAIAIVIGLIFASIASAQSQLIAHCAAGANPYAIAASHGIKVLDQTQGAPFVLFWIPAWLDPDVVQTQLQGDPGIVWAEDEFDVGWQEGQSALKGGTLPAIGGRSKLYAINQNVLRQINWSKSLAFSPGRLVRVAILDTGLSHFQADLWSKVDASVNIVEPQYIADDIPRGEDSNGNGVPDEAVGHGTMIAGLVDEIDPQSRFVIARVADSDGDATAWSVIKGLAFAVVNGAEVANMSLGSPDQIPALSDVIDWCGQHNLLVVAGAGNASTNTAMFPARFSDVICVTGLNPDNTKASFSNWDSGARSAAPATGIVSEWWDGHLGIWSGTSFSAPMVAAAVADCLRRKGGPLSGSFLRNAIRDSGLNIDNLNPAYQGQLGTLLDIQALDSRIQKN